VKYITIEANTTEYDTESLERFLNAAVAGFLAFCQTMPSDSWRRSQQPVPALVSVFDYLSGTACDPVKLKENRAHTSNRLSVAKPAVVHGESPMTQLAAGLVNADFHDEFYVKLATRACSLVGLCSRYDGVVSRPETWPHLAKAITGIRVTATSSSALTLKEARTIKRKANTAAQLDRACRVVEYSLPGVRERVASVVYDVDRMHRHQRVLVAMGGEETARFQEARQESIREMQNMIAMLNKHIVLLEGGSDVV
jgi:hypothetical protein